MGLAPGRDQTPLDPTDEDLEVEPGQVVRLDPGEDISTPATPDSGGTYEPFQYRTLLQIAAALGVPYGYLTGDTAKRLCLPQCTKLAPP